MAARPVTGGETNSGSWRLAEPHAGRAQGIIVSGYDHLPHGRALMLEFAWKEEASGGQWLQALDKVAPVTAADGPTARACAVALSWTGLAKMGLHPLALNSFAPPFREGMFQVDRMRRLYDRRGEKWTECVIKDGPRWSANTPPTPIPSDRDHPDPIGMRDIQPAIVTKRTVHAIVLLHTATEEEAQDWAGEVEAALKEYAVKVVHRREMALQHDDAGMVREHFGFADGVSQPVPWDAVAANSVPLDPWNGIALGDVLLGHVDGHNEVDTGPFLPPDKSKAQPAAAGLAPHSTADGYWDFGSDGSYMVVRELLQDVAGFWQAMEGAAKEMREANPEGAADITATWVAERIIGRAMSGDVLRPDGPLKRRDPAVPDNDFGYFEDDPVGMGCPLGSHMRRGNPRDGLAREAKRAAPLLESAKRHRMLRRGRKFGKPIADRMVDDGEERGLLFLAINSDIERQFEFVQQTWMMNQTFATLNDETDPLIGPGSDMTIGAKPVRRRLQMNCHVQLSGGDYFFLPSLPALRYLESL